MFDETLSRKVTQLLTYYEFPDYWETFLIWLISAD